MALRLNGSSSGYVELDVPADAGSHTLTLPDGGGSSGNFLRTDGSGGLSWATPAGGKILQVSSATKTDTQSTSSSSPVDITDLSVTMPVASSSNKLLITGFVVLGFYSDVNRSVVIDVNGSAVGSGAAAGSRTTAHSGGNYASADDRWKTICAPVNFLYQCTASGSHTVKLRFFNGDTSGQSLYVNRSQLDDNASYQTRYVSTLTVSEVQG